MYDWVIDLSCSSVCLQLELWKIQCIDVELDEDMMTSSGNSDILFDQYMQNCKVRMCYHVKVVCISLTARQSDAGQGGRDYDMTSSWENRGAGRPAIVVWAGAARPRSDSEARSRTQRWIQPGLRVLYPGLRRAERRPEQPAGLDGCFTLLQWPPGRASLALRRGLCAAWVPCTAWTGKEAQRAHSSSRYDGLGCMVDGRWAWAPTCDHCPFIKTPTAFGRTLSSSSEIFFTVNHTPLYDNGSKVYFP